MSALLWIGVVLLILWIVAVVLFKVAGFLIHLALIVGVILLVVWFIRRML